MGQGGVASDTSSQDEAMRSVPLLLDSSSPERPNSSNIEEGQSPDSEDPAASSVTGLLIGTIFVACCGSFAFGCALAYTSPVQSDMESDLSLSTSQFSLFGSLVMVGSLVASLINGRVTDYIGRKRSLGLAAILSIAGWVFIASSQGVWSLYSGRLLVGFAVGFYLYVISIYVSEIAPKNWRGAAGMACTAAVATAEALTLVVGLVVSWRVLALLVSIPCMTQIIGLFFVPESPRWLLRVGRYEECEMALNRLRGYGVDTSHEIAEIKESNRVLQTIPHVNICQLFQPKYAYVLTVVLGLMTFNPSSGAMGMLFYANYIFEAAGFSGTIGSIGLAIMQVVATIIGLLSTDKVGRRILLMVATFGMTISCMFVGLSFLLKDNESVKHISSCMAFFGVLLFFAAYSIGMRGVPYIIMSELFPMNAKGAAGSIAIMVSSSLTCAVTYSFNLMMDWSESGTFFVFAGVNACAFFFVTNLVPETKKISLEAIQGYTVKQGDES